jgi:hypothetical protein
MPGVNEKKQTKKQKKNIPIIKANKKRMPPKVMSEAETFF